MKGVYHCHHPGGIAQFSYGGYASRDKRAAYLAARRFEFQMLQKGISISVTLYEQKK